MCFLLLFSTPSLLFLLLLLLLLFCFSTNLVTINQDIIQD